jgi:hypothetical protein
MTDQSAAPPNVSALPRVANVAAVPVLFQCGTCNAYYAGTGTCRAYAPGIGTTWPPVNSTDWCREWQSVAHRPA